MEEHNNYLDPYLELAKYEPIFFFRHLSVILLAVFGFIFLIGLYHAQDFVFIKAVFYVVVGSVLSISLGESISNRREQIRYQKLNSLH